MTEDVQVSDVAAQDQAVESPETEVVTDAETPVEAAPEPPAEKMIPQSQVSKIAAREAREAAEKARQEVMAQFESQKQASSLGGIDQASPEQIRELIRQEAQQMSRQAMAQQIESDFKSKIAAERMADPDFADLYDELNIEAHPELVIWANGLDNTAKIIKDLAQNPTKYSNILMLAKSGAPQMAQKELQKLSNSIKANLEAQKQPKAPEPLGQLKPSNIGADSGSFEVSDFRQQPWLRG